jgi:hypothetical protein
LTNLTARVIHPGKNWRKRRIKKWSGSGLPWYIGHLIIYGRGKGNATNACINVVFNGRSRYCYKAQIWRMFYIKSYYTIT